MPDPAPPPAPVVVAQDKAFWKRSAFWTTLISILTFVGLQFPEWDKQTKVAIQIVQFVMTLFVVDQVTRSVDMRSLAAQPGVVMMERTGETIDPALYLKKPTVEDLQAQIESLKKDLAARPPAQPPPPTPPPTS